MQPSHCDHAPQSQDFSDLESFEGYWKADYDALVKMGFTVIDPNPDSFLCKQCPRSPAPNSVDPKSKDSKKFEPVFPPGKDLFDEIVVTPFMHHIVNTSFMTYGFGCWDRIAVQLREFEVTPESVHYYVHLATGISNFEPYMGIQLNLDDLSSWVTTRMNKMPVKPQFYIEPQLMFKELAELPEAVILSNLRRCAQGRFQMTPSEIALGLGYYEKRDVPLTEIAVDRVRTSDTESKPKNIFTFLDYSYDNGHSGTYPLDTGKAGLLREDCGTYKIGMAEKHDIAQQQLEARLAIADSTFNRAYKYETPTKRQKVDQGSQGPAWSMVPIVQPSGPVNRFERERSFDTVNLTSD